MKKIFVVICVIILLFSCGCTRTFNKGYTVKGEFYVASGSIDSTEDTDATTSTTDLPNIIDFLKSEGFTNDFYDYLTENYDLDISLTQLCGNLYFYSDKTGFSIYAEVTTYSRERADKIMEALLKFTPQYVNDIYPGAPLHVSTSD